MANNRNIGTGVAIGAALGVMLWLITEDYVFVAAGVMFGIVFGTLTGSREQKTPDQPDPRDGHGDTDGPPPT